MRYALFAVLLALPVGVLAWLRLPGGPIWLFLAVLIAGLVLAVARSPAAWSEARRFDAHDADLVDGAREALRVMGVRWREASAGVLSARVSLSWRSWGERMNVHVMDGRVECDSRCVYGLVDWGKNRQNVIEFFDALQTAVGAVGNRAVPWKSGTMSPLDDAKRRLAFWKRLRWVPSAIGGVGCLVLLGEAVRGKTTGEWIGVRNAVAALWFAAGVSWKVTRSCQYRAERLVREAQEQALS